MDTARPLGAFWLLLAGALVLSSSVLAQEEGDGGNYFEIDAINPSLGGVAPDANLETPQACVEHFVLAARQGEWQKASAALNFRLLGEIDPGEAGEVTEHFFFVLNQELWIDWRRLPDRPDGLEVGSSLGPPNPMDGKARRSIELGTIELENRQIPIMVERVKPEQSDPVWLFSAQTVDNIEGMWEMHGPSWLARQMPSWARERWRLRVPVWQWIGALLVLLLGPFLGYVAATVVCRMVLERIADEDAHLGERLRWPVGAAVGALFVWLMFDLVLGLPSQVAGVIEPLFMILFVAAVVWLAMRITTFFVDQVVNNHIRDLHEEESVSRKRLLTQVTVARHVILLVLVLLGIAAVLLELGLFHTLGLTLLTSAGALAVLLSLAGRAVVGNLIAGLQIALAQPFRIGDTVYVEGNWGHIEDITYVDVIICTWDERRLVFPVSYFISNWFENWSKTDPFLVKASYLKVDYGADVEAIRKKFIELVENDDEWAGDPDEPEVLVTEYGDETMTLRLTCAGEDPSVAWSLSCRIREQMMAWLQQAEDGRYLPRRRVLVSELPALSESEGQGQSRSGSERQSQSGEESRKGSDEAGGKEHRGDAGAETRADSNDDSSDGSGDEEDDRDTTRRLVKPDNWGGAGAVENDGDQGDGDGDGDGGD